MKPRGQQRWHRLAAPVALGAVILLSWEAVTRSGVVSEFFLPTPEAIGRTVVRSIVDGQMLRYTRVTVQESLAGALLGVVVALPLGYAIARSPLIASALQPYVAASQAVPAIAIAPLLALWLGYGLLPIAVLCAILVFFPMVVNTALGVHGLDPDVLNASRVDGASGWQRLRHIEFPLALPSVLAGVRTGLTFSITGAVVGEFVMGGEGLGQLLAVQRNYADTAGVFATLLMLATLAAVFYGVLRVAERMLSYDRSD